MLLLQKQQEIKAKLASEEFRDFVQYTKPDYEINWHHDLLMDYLQQFAEGKIKKLMVFMPPQHGKSELTSRRLPAYLENHGRHATLEQLLEAFPNKTSK